MIVWVNTKDPRIKKRDGVYWARFMRQGRRVEISLGTKNFEVAKNLVGDIEAKILLGRSWKKEKQLFEDAWLEFLIDKKEGNKVRPAREKTLKEYAFFGKRFYLPFFGSKRLSDIDDESWREFIEWVKKNFGEIQFFNIRKYMMGFLTWAKRHGKILNPPYLLDPDAKKNLEKEEFTPGKAYTKKELKAVRDAAKAHHRFYLFILMAQYMGMRPHEITQLKKDRIDFKNNVIWLKRIDTKTNKSRRVPIHKCAEAPLKAQIKASNPSPYLFPNRNDKARPMDVGGFKKIWSGVVEKVGLEGRIYDFRHTFITYAMASGVNPIAVAEITGTSIRIIQKYYLHFSEKDLNKAIANFKL